VYVVVPGLFGVTGSGWLLLVGFKPLQSPLAVHEEIGVVAFVADQLMVALWPAIILFGLTERVTIVGVGPVCAEAVEPNLLPPPPYAVRPITENSTKIRVGALRRERPTIRALYVERNKNGAGREAAMAGSACNSVQRGRKRARPTTSLPMKTPLS